MTYTIESATVHFDEHVNTRTFVLGQDGVKALSYSENELCVEYDSGTFDGFIGFSIQVSGTAHDSNAG